MTGTTTNRLSIVGADTASGQQPQVQKVKGLGLTCVIADDHPSVTLAVTQLLSEVTNCDPSRFTAFTTTTSLLEACAEPAASPRMIVLDLVMSGGLKRVELVRALRRVDPTARILVYTAEESPFLARAVFDAGAIGFVVKTSPAAELMDAIAVVGQGRRHIDQNIDLESVKTHPWTSLTDSERAVLLAFCRGEKAADIVAGTGRSYSTVTTHKYNGLSKLGLRDGSELLPYIYANGLLHELDSEPYSR